MMMTDSHKGVVALETTNEHLLKLKKGLFEYLRKYYEPTPVILKSMRMAYTPFEKQSERKEEPSYPQSDTLMQAIEEPKPFSAFLFQLIDAKHLDDVELYKKAQIDRKLFSKMKDPDYQPSKETVFKLILALQLTLREAKDFLENIGYSFSRSSKTDLIVKYCIENQVFDLFTVNGLLVENGNNGL